MQLIKTQPKEIEEITKKSIPKNAFFAHSYNLLIAMLAAENIFFRHKPVNGIIDIRNNKVHSHVERSDLGYFCETTLTMKLTEYDLREAYSTSIDVPNYPNNRQCVERAVEMISELCELVYGHER